MPNLFDVDPYAPLGLNQDRRKPGQREIRRAQILAATRQAMSEDGYRQFNVATVARNCGVSIQTVYYNFGSKRDLLVSALHEYNQFLHASCITRNPSPTVFLDIVYFYCKCAEEMQDFMREWLLCAYDPAQPLLIYLQKHGQRFKVDIIDRISEIHPIRSGSNSNRVAYLLSKSNTSSLFDWVHHQDNGELKRQIITSTAELVCQSFNENVSALVNDWMRDRLIRHGEVIFH